MQRKMPAIPIPHKASTTIPALTINTMASVVGSGEKKNEWEKAHQKIEKQNFCFLGGEGRLLLQLSAIHLWPSHLAEYVHKKLSDASSTQAQ